MQLFTALLLALALASSTTASPIVDAATIKRSEDIVVMAQITEPAQGVIWRVGSEQPVAWNKSTIPPQADTETASILLGYFDSDGLDHVDFGKFHFGPSSYNYHYGRCCFVLKSYLCR